MSQEDVFIGAVLIQGWHSDKPGEKKTEKITGGYMPVDHIKQKVETLELCFLNQLAYKQF